MPENVYMYLHVLCENLHVYVCMHVSVSTRLLVVQHHEPLVSLSHRVWHVHLVRRVGRCHAHILRLAERDITALGPLAEALQKRQCGPPEHEDGEEHYNQSGRAQDLDDLVRRELAALVHQIQG